MLITSSQGRFLNYTVRMALAGSFLCALGLGRVEAQTAKTTPPSKGAPTSVEHKALLGLNLEGVLAGIRVNKDYVDLKIRKNEMAGYQMMPDKKCTLLNVREALEHLHRIGTRYFVFDIADTASGRVLSLKVVRVTSPHPDTLRLEGLHEKDRNLLRELTKRLKVYEPKHPAVTMRLANHRNATLPQNQASSLQGRLDYHIFVDEGLEATRQGKEMAWTFNFKGVRLSQLRVNGEQIGMTAPQFIEAMRPWAEGGKAGVISPSRLSGSLIVFKKGKPVRLVMEFSNFAYDEKRKILTAQAIPLRNATGEVRPPAELLEGSTFVSKPSTGMFLDCGEMCEATRPVVN